MHRRSHRHPGQLKLFGILTSYRRPLRMLAQHRLAICGGVLMVSGFSLLKIWMARVIFKMD